MPRPENAITVERVKRYSDDVAAAIGRLMPFLSPHANQQAIPESALRAIIESPDREQFVARLHERVVGSAVLNIVAGNLHKKAWLEDFVTDPQVRGQGVGYRIWEDMTVWCQERDIDNLEFTSNPLRIDAHEFYLRQGAKIRETTVFEVPIPEA